MWALKPLIGGAFIGLAGAILLYSMGRIAGISGILGGLFNSKLGENSWRLLFLIGLLIAGLLFGKLWGPVEYEYLPLLQTALAGLLVGYGTRLGSGCTSGHGVCGISRLSPRSILATLIFMAYGFATVFLLRHVR